MIIKELELKNVRSYRHALISLPLGKTLFEGDIGSGKSTILMAIEFALFGLGSETGGSLLKLGEDKGGVRMKFEVGGGDYEVSRGLERKGGSVQQTDGQLVTPGEDYDLSPRELKEKVLEVLEFNEAPDPKAQSLIYRYAVYTPQEEMKQVLSMGADTRLQTLRRAFRVEDYKTAAENSGEISRGLRGDVRQLEGEGLGLERLKVHMAELEKEEGEQSGALEVLRKHDAEGSAALEKLRAEVEELHAKQVSMEGLRGEKTGHDKMLKESVREAAKVEKEIADITGREGKIEEALEKLKGLRPPTRKTPAQLKALERKADEEVKRLTEVRATIRSKLEDYGTIMKGGVCPVCERPVEAHDFAGKKAAKEEERRHVSEELEKAEKKREEASDLRERAEDYRRDREVVNDKREDLGRLKTDRFEKEGSLAEWKGKAEEAKGKLEELAGRISELEEVTAKVGTVGSRAAQVEEELGKTRVRVGKVTQRLQDLDKRKAELAIDIVAKQGAGERRDFLKENEIWLSDYFEPTVELIERSVLATINQEFDTLFQKWFSMLVADPDKEVRVDEDFTPLVTQGGYEQDVGYLSGGERTSVALAYRLALNTLAQRVSAGMKSNLLILDEPTDGFSPEQLGNVREVLDDVGSPQVIIVSHDKELESFADQIFRVRKVGGNSVVAVPVG